MSDDDLRDVDGHESWRGVCRTLGVDPDQHEQTTTQRSENPAEYV